MNIQPEATAGQFAAEVYHELLTLVRRELRPHAPVPRRQQWRFTAPEPNPAVQAYWAEVYKHEWAAIDAEWATPRIPVLIANESPAEEVRDVTRQQAV